MFKQIERLAQLGQTKIGIIVLGTNSSLKRLVRQLKSNFADTELNLSIQGYYSGALEGSGFERADEINFVAGSSITVVNVMSSKGSNLTKSSL